MKNVAQRPRRIEFRCDDPNLTPAAGLATVAEIDRVLAIVAAIDEHVGSLYRPGARHRPYSAGQVVMGLVESQLAGGDFLCDIDTRRKDTAGAVLRALPRPPASTTVGYLARRFGPKQLAGIETANAAVIARAFAVLPEAERARIIATRPTIDLDPTDVEVYGKKKQGMEFNYMGQRCGRPHPAVWAEAGMVLAADLGSGVSDPRPQAPSLIARAICSLPCWLGLGCPILRADSGFFDAEVAWAALRAGADFAIAAKRNPAVWRAIRAVDPEAWLACKDMDGAEVALCSYRPEGWPPQTRAVVRRVRVEAEEVRSDPRSRRRRTIDPVELKAVRSGEADHAYAYVVILTSLDWELVEIEAWFRLRAQVEERIKDSKLGMALRHLPSGYEEVNAVWMWAAFLALNISAVLSAFANNSDAAEEASESSAESHCVTLRSAGDDETTKSSEAEPPARRHRRCPDRAHGKRLRREIIMIPGRLAHHARSIVVHLHPSQAGGPMLTAYAALSALPSFSSG